MFDKMMLLLLTMTQVILYLGFLICPCCRGSGALFVDQGGSQLDFPLVSKRGRKTVD